MNREIRQHSRETETAQWRVYLTMGALVVVVLAALTYSFYSGIKATRTYAPLADAAMEIKLEAAVGHLWLEEILSGDRNEDIEIIWKHLDQSAWYANAMLEGGSNEEGTYIPLADRGLRQKIKKVADKLTQLRALTEQRYAARERSAAGTEIDEQFDAVFRDFMMQAEAAETALQKLMNRERLRFVLMQSVLIVLCLILAALVVVVLHREQARVLSALQEVHTLSMDRQRYLDVAGVMLIAFDAEQRVSMINPRGCDVLGAPREEIIGKNWFDTFLPPEQIDEVKAVFGRLMAGEVEPVEYHDNPIVRADGQQRIIAWHNAVLKDTDGNITGLLSSGEDITERKTLMEELRREKDLLQFSMEASRIGAWYLDLIDHSSRRSNEHDRIFGYETPLPEWTYEMFLEHVLPEDREKADQAFQHAVATQTDWNFECRIRRADGEIRWIGAIGRQMLLDDGAPRLMTGIVQDITERKQAEQQLQEAHTLLEQRVEERTAELKTRTKESETLNRAMINLLQDLKKTNRAMETAQQKLSETNQELEAFAYSVSHDLRAPLRHIEGFVNLLLKREADHLDDTSARYLDTIAQSSSRMGQLIDDLLAFSRTGRTEMHLKPVDSNDIIQEAIHELSPLTKDRRIVWEIDDLPAVMADRSLLRLVWNNLIGNAVKYTAPREEACIEIGATEEKHENGTSDVAFFIRDNGVGFDPQYTGKLFGVFQRLHRDDEFEGTGIGLATVKRIVHRHGGQVRAEGKVDEGATFYFTLKGAHK